MRPDAMAGGTVPHCFAQPSARLIEISVKKINPGKKVCVFGICAIGANGPAEQSNSLYWPLPWEHRNAKAGFRESFIPCGVQFSLMRPILKLLQTPGNGYCSLPTHD